MPFFINWIGGNEAAAATRWMLIWIIKGVGLFLLIKAFKIYSGQAQTDIVYEGDGSPVDVPEVREESRAYEPAPAIQMIEVRRAM